MGMLSVLLAMVIIFFLAISVQVGWARGGHNNNDEIPFAEAHIFFELNNTDGDLGIHALIDGEPWKRLEIEDPNGRRMLKVKVKGRLRGQGLTEIFFESAEPTFDELPPEQFFRRFPEGTYEIEGITLEGDELESEVELTHVMPAPPVAYVNNEPVALQCDEEEPGYDATEVELNDDGSVTISWDPVTESHPDPNGGGAGVQPPVLVTIHNYEIVVEVEQEIDGEEFTSVFSAVLPPHKNPDDLMSITIPSEFIALGDEFKYEVLAREESFNQTAIESCFVIVEE